MGKKILTDIDIDNNLLVNGASVPSNWNGGIILKETTGYANVPYASNQASLYVSSGELHAVDSSGNDTPISPHDDDNKWVFRSKNSATGKSVTIHMEDLVAAVEAHLGVSFSEIVEGE
jgi:hypothetical protein